MTKLVVLLGCIILSALNAGASPLGGLLVGVAAPFITGVTCGSPPSIACTGTVGDTTGTVVGTLTATSVNGSLSSPTYTCASTCSAGQFKIVGATIETGPTPYVTAGAYSINVQVAASNAGNSPQTYSVPITIKPGASPSLAQQRVVNNLSGAPTPSTMNLAVGQPFGKAQVPSGDGVVWKTGAGTVIPSQQDDCTSWPDGSLRFCSFTLTYPASLGTGATDTIKAYDNPAGAVTPTCFDTLTNIKSDITAHDYRLEATIAGTTYTLSANNEIANEPNTHAILYRNGPRVCSYYVYGELRNGTTFGSTPQGTIWGRMYIDVFADTSQRVWGEIQICRPLDGGNVAFSSCPKTTLAPDANGDDYALKDYSLGSPTLFGCGSAGCVANGHGNNTSVDTYTGNVVWTVSADAYGYDTANTPHAVVVAYPNGTHTDPSTTGFYDAYMAGWINYDTTEINAIVSTPTPGGTPSYAPSFCPPDPASCHYGQTSNNPYIGQQTAYFARCFLAGGTTVGFRECNYDRVYALVFGSVYTAWRDANTGTQFNLNSNFSPPAGTAGLSVQMGTNTTVRVGIEGGSIPFSGLPGSRGYAVNHDPNWAKGQCQLTGERPFCDMVLDQANFDIGVSNPSRRNVTINTHAYSGVVTSNKEMRANAWQDRDIADAAWMVPDKLADGSTINPLRSYFNAQYTGALGQAAYWNDWLTTPWAVAGQAALGWLFSGNSGAQGVSFNTDQGPGLPFDDVWQSSYWTGDVYLNVLRGLISPSNKLLTSWAHLNWAGGGVNGCMAVWPYVYEHSATTAARPFATSASGILGQAWSDIYWGDVTDAVSLNMTADPGQVAGSTVVLNFASSTIAGNIKVGMLFTIGVNYSGGGFTIPQETTISSIVVNSPTQITVTLSNPITGAGNYPTTSDFFRVTGWTAAGANSPQAQSPLIPIGGCPASGLVTNNVAGGNINYAQYYWAASVVALAAGTLTGDTTITSDGTTINNYFRGSVVPSGKDSCGQSTGSWDTNNLWPTSTATAAQPQWRLAAPGCQP